MNPPYGLRERVFKTILNFTGQCEPELISAIWAHIEHAFAHIPEGGSTPAIKGLTLAIYALTGLQSKINELCRKQLLLIGEQNYEAIRQFEWHKSHSALATQHDLKETERHILMDQKELAAGLMQMQTQIGKVAKEQSDKSDALAAEIANLKALILAGGPVTPEVAAAFTSTQAALQALDDVIPDAPAEPAPAPEPPVA